MIYDNFTKYKNGKMQYAILIFGLFVAILRAKFYND